MKEFLPYLRYLKTVQGAFWTAIFCGLIFAVASGLGLPFMADRVFPRVFAGDAGPLTTWELLAWSSLLPAAFVVRGISGYFNTYLISFCGVRVLERIREELFAKLQRLPVSFFQARSSGDLISRVMGDTAQVQLTVTGVANDIIKQPLTFLSALAFLTYLSVQNREFVFILLSLAIVPICVFPVRYIGRKLLRRAHETQTEMGSVTNRLSENLQAYREVRAYGLEEREQERFRRTSREYLRLQMKVVKYGNALSPIIEVISAFGVSISFIYAYRAGIGLEKFLALFVALYMSYEPIKKIGAIHNQIQRGLGAARRIREILDEQITVQDPPQPVAPTPVRGEIVFENVFFSYGHSPVLSEIVVTLPAGSVTALVGPSGAGKSTFANLVPRFFDPTAGTVSIDGIPLPEWSLSHLRRQIALVSQDPVLFNDTLYNNILFGRLDASREEVEDAARKAYADAFIRSLDSGYDTIVGERGTNLSGGQRQRLAIARAFLRRSPILILDEATSALDTESEESIQKALAALIRGKTVLIIAHRFSTIRFAERILVFNEGRIEANGSHEELLDGNRLYHRLFQAQS